MNTRKMEQRSENNGKCGKCINNYGDVYELKNKKRNQYQDGDETGRQMSIRRMKTKTRRGLE